MIATAKVAAATTATAVVLLKQRTAATSPTTTTTTRTTTAPTATPTTAMATTTNTTTVLPTTPTPTTPTVLLLEPRLRPRLIWLQPRIRLPRPSRLCYPLRPLTNGYKICSRVEQRQGLKPTLRLRLPLLLQYCHHHHFYERSVRMRPKVGWHIHLLPATIRRRCSRSATRQATGWLLLLSQSTYVSTGRPGGLVATLEFFNK